MKKQITFKKKENAQVIPILAITLLVLIMMVALVLDGSALMLGRRSAQNAADAGALAGARVLCLGGTTEAAKTAAINYAITQNKATSATADVLSPHDNIKVGEVVVTAQISQNSFFARVFNKNTLTSSATAGAGCFSPAAKFVIPIAWSCRKPSGTGSMSKDCEYVKLDWTSQMKPIIDTYGPSETNISNHLYYKNPADPTPDLLYGNSIYIIMDSNKVCGDDVNCDFNNDGRPELETGGNRGWLNLTGDSSGKPNLTGWIEDGVQNKISIHTWLSVIDGNKTPVYTSLKTRIDDIVWIPIFNWICNDYPNINDPNDPCEQPAHALAKPGVPLKPEDVETIIIGNPTLPVFHIVGFAPFYITCVHQKKDDNCPGFNIAQQNNQNKKSIADNTNTVEGYFISGYPFPSGDVETGGVDLGDYIVSLTR